MIFFTFFAGSGVGGKFNWAMNSILEVLKKFQVFTIKTKFSLKIRGCYQISFFSIVEVQLLHPNHNYQNC
jgi:hypothetical protein